MFPGFEVVVSVEVKFKLVLSAVVVSIVIPSASA